jgi:ribosomal protein L9
LSEQVWRLSSSVEAEHRQRAAAEEERRELREKLQASELKLTESVNTLQHFQSVLSRCFLQLDKALPALTNLRQEVDIDLVKPPE